MFASKTAWSTPESRRKSRTAGEYRVTLKPHPEGCGTAVRAPRPRIHLASTRTNPRALSLPPARWSPQRRASDSRGTSRAPRPPSVEVSRVRSRMPASRVRMRGGPVVDGLRYPRALERSCKRRPHSRIRPGRSHWHPDQGRAGRSWSRRGSAAQGALSIRPGEGFADDLSRERSGLLARPPPCSAIRGTPPNAQCPEWWPPGLLDGNTVGRPRHRRYAGEAFEFRKLPPRSQEQSAAFRGLRGTFSG